MAISSRQALLALMVPAVSPSGIFPNGTVEQTSFIPGYITSAVITPTSCSDSSVAGTNSLREAIGLANDGDTIELSELAIGCSVVTLDEGEIQIPQNDLTLKGPANGGLTIVGSGQSRLFKHTGSGTLTVSHLVMTGGNYTSAASAKGGCIRSHGSVSLLYSTVTGCGVTSESGYAYGGAVAADENLSVLSGTISQSAATAAKSALGGGAFANGGMLISYSSVSHNTATGGQDGGAGAGYGGGIWVRGTQSSPVIAKNATFDGNAASGNGGGVLIYGNIGTFAISNSTISGNDAQAGGGAIAVYTPSSTLSIFNSTIAYNQTEGKGGGIYATTPLFLESTIVAGNQASSGAASADVYAFVVGGSANLIVASNVALPVDTKTDPPQLGPLQQNGGQTKSHALSSNSPARDAGSNSQSLEFDQRGPRYPRNTAGSIDIGAIQFDSIFSNGLETWF